MKIFKEIEGFFSSKISVLRAISTLVLLEIKLARMSIIPLLLNLVMLFMVFFTLWLSLMGLFGYVVSLALSNIIYGILSIIMFNLIVVVGLFKYLQFNLKSMSFEKTRAYFSTNVSHQHEKLEKGSLGAPCNAESNIDGSAGKGNKT
jgi:hypothetical protein